VFKLGVYGVSNLDTHSLALVLKADGLSVKLFGAGGSGAIICVIGVCAILIPYGCAGVLPSEHVKSLSKEYVKVASIKINSLA